MPRSPLFSTYRQGENRVTSSILAVFERTDVTLVERLLSAASGEAALSIVRFANQVTGPSSVPDGEISASCRYLFEVKTKRDAIRKQQLEGHLAGLDGRYGDERLFVITPDGAAPHAIATLGDARLFWFNFGSLSEAIEDLLSDPRELVPEQVRFLLRELQALFRQDGLLDFDDTVVVAARRAWPEYLMYAAYICQPNRAFKVGLLHMGFYTDGAIQPTIPQILARRDNLRITRETQAQLVKSHDPNERAIGVLIQRILDEQVRSEGDVLQVFLLSDCDDEKTLQLEKPIPNALPTPWTQGQRYTRFQLLKQGPPDTAALARS